MNTESTTAPDQAGSYLERELYELARRDSSIFEFLQMGTLDGIWYWDLENPDNEWMSPRFWQALGYSPEARHHLTSEYRKVIHPEDLAALRDNFERHCADPTESYDQVVRLRHRDGSTVWMRCRGIVIRDEAGKPHRMLGAHTDVTQLKELEAELQSKAAALEQSNRDLEQFAYAASHDLHEPLRKIASFSELLEQRYRGRLDETADSYIDFIVDGAERMQTLLADLLSFCRLGLKEATIEDVDLDSVMRELSRDLSLRLDETGAELVFGDLPIVRGSHSQLRRLFQNLLENALKFSNESAPRIVIDSECDGSEWCFSITDNGIGIDERYAKRIFDLLERLNSRSDYPGSGIGLATCQRIVEAHGGKIWLDTSERPGTTFQFTLPVPVDQPEA